jgi:hypothetical protein
MGACTVDLTGLGYDSIRGCFENGNENSNFINGEEYLE